MSHQESDQFEPVVIEEVGEPLSLAIVGNQTNLSKESQDKIKNLMGSDPWHFFCQLTVSWIEMIAAIGLAQWIDHWWATVVAIFFIATRQNVLGLLVHEQTHRSGLQSKLGDYITNFFCAYPLFFTIEGYRRIHLAHHRHYFTVQDPDYRRKQGEQWTFPQKVRRFVKSLLIDLTGLNLIYMAKGKGSGKVTLKRETGWKRGIRPVYYAALAVVFTLTGTWTLFLLYWLIPVATVLQVIVRWGAVCEHKYNLIDPTVVESTPLIEPTWWESWLLPNLNFTLHTYHHWYPAVPFAKLPQVHDLFKQENLVREKNVFKGYLPYLAYLLRGREPTKAQSI